jgi:MFS family permease
VSRRTSIHWIVFGAAFLTLLLAAGARSAPGVLLDPLHDEFGWSKATIGLAVSINVVLFGLVGPFAAALQQRFGLRRVTMIALALMSIGSLLTSQISEPWQLFLLWGVVVGIGSGCMASVFASSVAARWFVQRRGLVSGALTAGSASGQLVFLPLLTRLADRHGWPWVGIATSIGMVGALVVVALFLRNAPADVGALPFGASEAPPEPPVTRPIRTAFSALADTWRSGAFILLFGSFAVCGLSTTGLVQTHFISAADHHAISSTSAATYLMLVGGFDIVGTLVSGYYTDRYDPRKLLCLYYLIRGASLFILDPALAVGGGGLFGFMALYGLGWVATVPPTIALCVQHFGVQRGTVVYGWVFAGHQLGAALAAWGAGYLDDRTGSYQLSFVIVGAMCLIAAAGVLRIGQPGDSDTVSPTAISPPVITSP